MTEKSKSIQRMVDLLRQGATLTELACPACASPLFKLKDGKLWCAQCEKRVVVVKEGESPTDVIAPMVLSTLESTTLAKIQEIEKRIKEEMDVEKLQELSSTLSTLLANLEKVRKMKERS